MDKLLKYTIDSLFTQIMIEDKMVGRVCGVYHHTVSFLVDKQMYSVFVGKHAPLSAFFLYIPDIESFDQYEISQDDLVYINDAYLTIGKATFNLGKRTQFVRPLLTVKKKSSDSRTWYQDLLRRTLIQNGFTYYSLGLDRIEDLIDQHIIEVLNKNAILELIGVGKGLTPSGDDFLCGVYTATLMLDNSSIVLDEIENAVLQKIDKISNVSKAQYQVCFMNSMPILHVEFAQQFIENNETRCEFLLSELLKYGHTSGIDYSVGVMYAVLKEGENNVQENSENGEEVF